MVTGCNWTVIDDCYLGRTHVTANSTKNWVAFLTKLGAYSSLAVENKTIVMKPEDWVSKYEGKMGTLMRL